MITKTKTYYVMDKEDLEKMASDFFKKEVKVSDMEMVFEDGLNIDTGRPIGAGIFIDIEGAEETFELLDDIFCKQVNVDEATWDQTFVEEEFIFNFDTSEFKSYERVTREYD